MDQQEMLDIQRHLKETRPDLKVGSRLWWVAMRIEKDIRHGR
jgi:hypothetical protein